MIQRRQLARRQVACGVLLALVAVAAAACSSSGSASGSAAAGSGSGSKSLGTLHVVLGNVPGTPAFLPLGVAQQLGYWKKLGLDVNIASLQGQAAAAQAVIAGKADIGITGPNIPIMAVSTNKAINLQTFYTWSRKATWAIVVPSNSPAQSLADLKGKTIGIVSQGNSDASAAATILSNAQGVPASSIKELPVGSGAQALEALKSGQVAAYSGGDADAAQINALGFSLRELPLPASVAGASDATFSGTPEFIKSHGDQLTAFGIGWSEAVVFCKNNIDACIKLFWKQYPQSAPSNASSDFNAAASPWLAVANVRIPKYYADDGKWGETTLPAWLSVAQVLGVNISAAQQPQLATYFTDALVPAMSNFDENAIADQAKNYKG